MWRIGELLLRDPMFGEVRRTKLLWPLSTGIRGLEYSLKLLEYHRWKGLRLMLKKKLWRAEWGKKRVEWRQH